MLWKSRLFFATPRPPTHPKNIEFCRVFLTLPTLPKKVSIFLRVKSPVYPLVPNPYPPNPSPLIPIPPNPYPLRPTPYPLTPIPYPAPPHQKFDTENSSIKIQPKKYPKKIPT